MAPSQPTTAASGLHESGALVDSLTTSEVARLSTEAIFGLAERAFRNRTNQDAVFMTLVAELDRREGWRDEGASSVQAWMVDHTGMSAASARAYAHVGERLFDLPHLAHGLSSGELTFDKVRTVVDRATPESDQEIAEKARTLSVKDLAQLARSKMPPSKSTDAVEYGARSLRFNDECRTIVTQLPRLTYAQVKRVLEQRAKRISSDGATPWDQRLADALVSLVRSGGDGRRSAASTTLVAHVPLDVLRDESSTLVGELEDGSLISAETVRRLACEATLVVAVDDECGHTMYEGRTRRDPTDAQRREVRRRDRHCRFPGCRNVLFTDAHHVRWWVRDMGPTDLDNLVTLCEHHHNLVHSRTWSMTGNANEQLTFVGPSGRVMETRPHFLWTQVTSPEALARSDRLKPVADDGGESEDPGG